MRFAQSFEPFGDPLLAAGQDPTAYGFTGEWTDATGLVHLRARYYDPTVGRFFQPDPFGHVPIFPNSSNRFIYSNNSPLMYIDPSGMFSESILKNSLQGHSLNSIFGPGNYNISRWGLYNLLLDARPFDTFESLFAEFNPVNPQYPLSTDPIGEWIVWSHQCELVFFNNSTGTLNLIEFVDKLNTRAQNWANTSGKWWRPATLEFHWYEREGEYYSDFYEGTHLPDLVVFGLGIPLEAIFDGGVFRIFDRYGGKYLGFSFGGGPIVSILAEYWEGYATRNLPAGHRKWANIPSEQNLRNIIEGFSASFVGRLVGASAGVDFWKYGTIALFADVPFGLGFSASFSVSAHRGKNILRSWHWVDTEIPAYGPP